MIATIARNNDSPYYTVANQREYDVWGKIRAQSSVDSPNGPKMRYCANLGHPTDDESGLIYMRARYYEPWTGRFVSEDPGRNGKNWFVYAKNDPADFADSTGKADVWLCLLIGLAAAVMAAGVSYLHGADGRAISKAFLVTFITAAATAAVLDDVQAATALEGFDLGLRSFAIGGGINAVTTLLVDILTSDTDNLLFDVMVSFFTGGVGGAVGGIGEGETGLYIFGGWLMNALQDLGFSSSRSRG